MSITLQQISQKIILKINILCPKYIKGTSFMKFSLDKLNIACAQLNLSILFILSHLQGRKEATDYHYISLAIYYYQTKIIIPSYSKHAHLYFHFELLTSILVATVFKSLKHCYFTFSLQIRIDLVIQIVDIHQS